MPRIAMDDVFSMGEGSVRGAVRMNEVVPLDMSEYFKLISGEKLSLASAMTFRQYVGRKWCDLIGSQIAVVQFFSDKFFEVLSSTSATGWRDYRPHLEDQGGKAVGGYRGLVVTGRCGPIDESRCVVAPFPPRGVKAWKGMYFDEQSWDGSDVFRPEGTGHVFVTRRVHDALVAARLTNLRLTPVSEIGPVYRPNADPQL